MTAENREAPVGPQEAERPVDPYRAYRELERWLGPGVLDRDTSNRLLLPNWREGAELIGTSIYTLDKNGKIIGQRYEKASDS